jgi:hypothetical protein
VHLSQVKRIELPDLDMLPEREGVVEPLNKPLKGKGRKVKFDKPVIQYYDSNNDHFLVNAKQPLPVVS